VGSPATRSRESECDRARLVHPVVGSFFGNLYVVDVRLADARSRDFNELALGAHVFNGGAAAIAHRGAQAADQLIDDGQHAAFVRDAAFNAFGHEFVRVVGRVLEIAVRRTVFHGAEAAHATIGLVRTALV